MLQFRQRELELKIEIRKTGQLCSGANWIATGQFETGSSRAKRHFDGRRPARRGYRVSVLSLPSE
jgi:hypothetical protein